MTSVWRIVGMWALVATIGTAGGGAIVVRAEETTRIDVNRASVAELTELPGIGPAKAAAIVDERSRKPFSSVDDLARVSGIGGRMLEQLRDHVVVSDGDEGVKKPAP